MLKPYIILLFIFPFIGNAQTRLILNNDVYLNLENGANLVLENPNADAIVTSGTGGNIISEGESNVVKWLIGSTNSLYTVPFTNSNLVKIPLVIDKTSSGSGAGYFEISTWGTDDMNFPRPASVSNMNLPNGTDGSLWVADRFWHIDASSYTIKPDVTLNINYEDNLEIAFPNTITESNLQAQQFNTNLGQWESVLLGINNSAANQINSIVIPGTSFYEDWILVDNTNPLPIELSNFEVSCDNETIDIVWTTQSEINNNYFTVEKSYDGITFFEISTITGAGNSNSTINYALNDNNTNELVYYRLKQVDFDGSFTFSEIETLNCRAEENVVWNAYFSENELIIDYESEKQNQINIILYGTNGQLIFNSSLMPVNGKNKMTLNQLLLPKGIYLMSLSSSNKTQHIKIAR
jgi:hypothetical protein